MNYDNGRKQFVPPLNNILTLPFVTFENKMTRNTKHKERKHTFSRFAA